MSITELEHKVGEAVRLLGAMANEGRLLVLCHLAEGQLTVTDLGERTGMSQPALSQQLSKLRAWSIVSARRSGRSVHYELAPGPARHVLETLYDAYCAP